MARARGVVLSAALALAALGCSDDPLGVDLTAAESAVRSDEAFDRVLAVAAEDGVTADAARALSIGAVRRAPVLAARAATEPEVVNDFVAALVDADAETIGPLTAAAVEGTGLALHGELLRYASLDQDAIGDLFDLPEVLGVPSHDLASLTDAVRIGGAGHEDEVWAGFVAALELAGVPEDGSLFGAVGDEALLALTDAGAPEGDAPGSTFGFDERAGPSVRATLGLLLHTDPAIRTAVDPGTAPGATLAEFVARPVVADLLDVLSSAETSDPALPTPAASLARLIVPTVP